MHSRENPGDGRSADTLSQFHSHDLIIMHLREAARLSGHLEGLDQNLFRHIIEMAVYAIQEAQAKQGARRLHS